MKNKEEIEKAKEELKIIWKETDFENSKRRVAIEILLQYIKELEAIKGMKEAIELSNMDIKSLLNLKYDNIKLHKMIDEMVKVIIDNSICNQFIKDSCKHYAGENKKLCDECIKQYFEEKVE